MERIGLPRRPDDLQVEGSALRRAPTAPRSPAAYRSRTTHEHARSAKCIRPCRVGGNLRCRANPAAGRPPTLADFRQLYTGGYILRTGHAHELYDFDKQQAI